jgi:hypothetical protein
VRERETENFKLQPDWVCVFVLHQSDRPREIEMIAKEAELMLVNGGLEGRRKNSFKDQKTFLESSREGKK